MEGNLLDFEFKRQINWFLVKIVFSMPASGCKKRKINKFPIKNGII